MRGQPDLCIASADARVRCAISVAHFGNGVTLLATNTAEGRLGACHTLSASASFGLASGIMNVR
jgi:hypothetical protein